MSRKGDGGISMEAKVETLVIIFLATGEKKKFKRDEIKGKNGQRPVISRHNPDGHWLTWQDNIFFNRGCGER